MGAAAGQRLSERSVLSVRRKRLRRVAAVVRHVRRSARLREAVPAAREQLRRHRVGEAQPCALCVEWEHRQQYCNVWRRSRSLSRRTRGGRDEALQDLWRRSGGVLLGRRRVGLCRRRRRLSRRHWELDRRHGARLRRAVAAGLPHEPLLRRGADQRGACGAARRVHHDDAGLHRCERARRRDRFQRRRRRAAGVYELDRTVRRRVPAERGAAALLEASPPRAWRPGRWHAVRRVWRSVSRGARLRVLLGVR